MHEAIPPFPHTSPQFDG